jgi:hypothetical protein
MIITASISSVPLAIGTSVFMTQPPVFISLIADYLILICWSPTAKTGTVRRTVRGGFIETALPKGQRRLSSSNLEPKFQNQKYAIQPHCEVR